MRTVTLQPTLYAAAAQLAVDSLVPPYGPGNGYLLFGTARANNWTTVPTANASTVPNMR